MADAEHTEGTANIFMAVEPLAGFQGVQVTERRTRQNWAQFIRHLVEQVDSSAKKVVLVMDNWNTHTIGSLYETFDAPTRRALAERLEIHHTPMHGSWLNMAETELSFLSRQCLDRRIDDRARLANEIAARERQRNVAHSKTVWQFTPADACTKPKRLYLSIDD